MTTKALPASQRKKRESPRFSILHFSRSDCIHFFTLLNYTHFLLSEINLLSSIPWPTLSSSKLAHLQKTFRFAAKRKLPFSKIRKREFDKK